MLIMGAAHINAAHLPATRELMLRLAAWAQDHTEEIKSAKGLACLAWGLACMGFLDPGLLRKVHFSGNGGLNHRSSMGSLGSDWYVADFKARQPGHRVAYNFN